MFEGRFFSSILLPAILALIMIGIGTSLSFSDFKNIFKFPRGLAVGLFGQLVLLPLIAILIAYISPISPSLKAGLVLIAACPGGATSNLIVHLFRGNVAMCVSFTIINSFLTILTIPAWIYATLYLFMGEGQGVSLPIQDSMFHILIMTVIPCTIGILLGHYFPAVIKKIRKPMDYSMPVLMAFGMIAAVFFEKKNDGVALTADIFVNVLPWTVLLNIGGLLSGFLMAWLFKLGNRNRMTISVEIGLHNTALAIAIATSQYMLDDRSMAIPATVYAMFSFFTAVAWAAFVRRHAIAFAIRSRRNSAKK